MKFDTLPQFLKWKYYKKISKCNLLVVYFLQFYLVHRNFSYCYNFFSKTIIFVKWEKFSNFIRDIHIFFSLSVRIHSYYDRALQHMIIQLTIIDGQKMMMTILKKLGTFTRITNAN